MQVLLLVTLLGFQNPTFGPDNPEGLVLTRNQKIRYAFQRKTFWKQVATPTVIPSKPPLTAAERQQMNRALDQIIALLKATPEGSSGVGFWTNESRRLSFTNYDEFPRSYPPAKVPPAYESRLFPFYHEDSLQPNGQWRLSNKGETESVSFVINQLPHPRYSVVIAQEEVPSAGLKIDFTLRPKLTGTWQGYPVYADSILVVTRPGRDPWAPVPLGRALKAALSQFEQDWKSAESRLAGYKEKNNQMQSPAYEKEMWDYFEKTSGPLKTTRPSNYATRKASMEREIRINRESAAAAADPLRDAKGSWYWNPVEAYQAAKARLDALSPADAAKPACFEAAKDANGRSAIKGDILPLGASPTCEPIVMQNFAYFDQSLPRSAPQILVIDEFGRCATLKDGQLVRRAALPQRIYEAPLHGCYRHFEMWKDLDWPKLQSILVP